ncbi:hypothetical protein [Hymenobacter defluvii]|uniref:Uncharacterized protein n=1 Tax=Hymenobacter defluvii TaxID=2054411 RepID=A0ABS3TAW7_9BACT|nr:hypothetical protein [Hymenobacter defluvii]MBO3270782.1 hypothetical protein [Hymenobacter defluvii]
MPENMTRAEHLQWAKDRALAYLEPPKPRHPSQVGAYIKEKYRISRAPVNADQLRDAWASFVSDLGKHPETANHRAIELGMVEALMGGMSTADKVRHFINGTN